jgi:HEAT repeat protein
MTGTNENERMQPVIGGERRRFPCFPVLTLLVCLLALHCGSGPEDRRLSIYELKREPTEENLQRIHAMLSDPDRDVRATALNALVGLAVPESKDLALDALDDSDGFVRATAVKLLGDLGDPDHVGAIARVLTEDPDAVARQRAAESLTRLEGEEAVQALARALADPMERVRMAAVQGLSKLDPGFATDELVRVLHDDAVWEIRAEAARALGLTGDPEIVAELEAALEDPNEFVRSAVENALRIHAEARGEAPATD